MAYLRFALLSVLLAPSLGWSAEESTPSDPGLNIALPAPADEAACRALFKQLASVDIAGREAAAAALIAKGPSVLPLAREYAKDLDAEIAAQARILEQRIMVSYDGYIPLDPKLKAALEKTLASSDIEKLDQTERLHAVAAAAGITLAIDRSVQLPVEEIDGLENQKGLYLLQAGLRVADLLQMACGELELMGVPRGSYYVVTTKQQAERIAVTRHTFNWSELGLSREEADRVGNGLRSFFPTSGTEIHTGSEVFSIRGNAECVPRAARLMALLKPGAPEALWPAAGEFNENALLENLSAPATLVLTSEDPLVALMKLKKDKHDVYVVASHAPEGEALQEGPFPRQLQAASPLRISLKQPLPLGLVLRWIERRARIVNRQEDMLAFETGPAGRLQFRLRPKGRRVLDDAVCGIDVGFVYPRAATPSAESDAAARAQLLKVLAPHLEIYPSIAPQRDLVVLRGRLFMQGPPATLRRALALVRQWRASGEGPPPPAWRTELGQKLAAVLDWNGSGMTGGKLIPRLRELGQVNILLEDNADGSAPAFKLTAQDAELLPRGKHTLSALLDDLARRAEAQWAMDMGAIVITPKGK